MGEKLCSKPAGKCGVERKRLRRNAYVPTRRMSDYGTQLKEKQKAQQKKDLKYLLRVKLFLLKQVKDMV